MKAIIILLFCSVMFLSYEVSAQGRHRHHQQIMGKVVIRPQAVERLLEADLLCC
jgi:hypothetical protein